MMDLCGLVRTQRQARSSVQLSLEMEGGTVLDKQSTQSMIGGVLQEPDYKAWLRALFSRCPGFGCESPLAKGQKFGRG